MFCRTPGPYIAILDLWLFCTPRVHLLDLANPALWPRHHTQLPLKCHQLPQAKTIRIEFVVFVFYRKKSQHIVNIGRR